MDVDRDVVSDHTVWQNLIVVSTPILQIFPRICKRHDPVSVQALARNLLLNASINPLSVGFPGREKSEVTLFA